MGTSKVRCPMSRVRRAKQFMPFDALKGFKEAIAATEIYTEPKKELEEFRIDEINATLTELKKGEAVIVTYYGNSEGKYLQLTGNISGIDPYWGTLKVGEVIVDFPEIYQIEILQSA